MMHTIKNVVKVSAFILIHLSCAMQDHKHSHHHHHSRRLSQVKIDVASLVRTIHEIDRQELESREQLRYNRKKKLACIALITSIIGGGTGIVVWLIK